MFKDKPWTGLPLPIDEKVTNFFEASVRITVGDGETAMFWTDAWHTEGKFSTIFQELFNHCTLRHISIKKALNHGKWIKHFKGNMTVTAIQHYVMLWNLVRNVQLADGVPDEVTWKWTADGKYSASLAYAAQFIGSIKPDFPPLIWRSDAPPKCKFYAWLAVQGRCMTADVLAKKGCPHDPLCSLCRAHPETASHLLATCPFAQDVWKRLLDLAELPAALAPGPSSDLASWLGISTHQLTKERRKLWLSMVPLVWWCLWKERNDRIFRHISAAPAAVVQAILVEARSWVHAGRRRLLALVDRPREAD
jgi:hypothetical protein